MTTEKEPQLRPFQQRVKNLVMEGKNIILQAPTGAGKTRAALAPFVQNLADNGNALPHSCIYATPLRVLSTQFYITYRERIAHLDETEGTEFGRQYKKLEKEPVSIQTGEQPNDPQFESLLTFCTIDQLLASMLAIPYGVGRSRANLNVGAMLGSYLVLDEFHLYPLLKESGESVFGARTTMLAMLERLKGITRFILMTATFSSVLLKELATLLDAEYVVVDDEDELRELAEERQRFFEVAGTPMSAEAIIGRHKECSMVLCNTVLRAQQTYWDLKQHIDERKTEVILLHSRLTQVDRKERSEYLIRELGKAPATWPDEQRYGWQQGQYRGKNLIVVATQVVEVGLDISVQTLHTEIAPANSIIQRAGRCARFAYQQGTVIVYDLPLNNEDKPSTTLPYDKQLCDATFSALRELDSTQPVGFTQEQQLINTVHTSEDTELLARFKKRKNDIVKEVFTNLNDSSSSVISSLIRDVAQVQILIHDNPKVIDTEPWHWQCFSMHPGSFAGHMKYLEEHRGDSDWVCKQAIAVPAPEDDEADNHQKTKFEWVKILYSDNVQSMQRTLRETIMIALPNTLATYHKELGFLLLDERLAVPWTPYQSTRLDKDKSKSKPKPIEQRDYKSHIGGLVNAYNAGIACEMSYVIGRLEKALELSSGTVDHAVRLAIACHDLGKLSEQWQQWAWEWQNLLYEKEGWGPYTKEATFFFAKTDFDFSENHRTWQHLTKTKRSNHACESVVAGMTLIADSLNVKNELKCLPVVRAVCGAIARHHTSNAQTSGKYTLKQGAIEAAKQALIAAQQNRPWTYDINLLNPSRDSAYDLVPTTDNEAITLPKRGRMHELETWLYFVIVRVLRLADQRADIFSN